MIPGAVGPWIVPDLWKTLENAFPTRSLDAKNASTRSTGIIVWD